MTTINKSDLHGGERGYDHIKFDLLGQWQRIPDRESRRRISHNQERTPQRACHNTDLGDGWEEEGTDPWYFTEFPEKKAYPIGINIPFTR